MITTTGKKTCFVISPLSTKGSDVRKEADALLWIINQAVQKHGFDVIRIDEVAKTQEITKEIVRLVRESDLCIIILTGNNPNVYYEAGRRHENGRPFIHLLKEGEKLPFDVAAINTIHYSNIESLGGIQELTDGIDSFVRNMKEEIAGAAREEITLSAIAEALKRIELKVERGGRPLATSRPLQLPADPTTAMRNPREAFMLAIARGDIDSAISLLPRLESILGQSKEFLHAGLICAQAGAQQGADIGISFLDNPPDWMKPEDKIELVGALVNYYSLTNREEEGIRRLFPVIDALAGDKTLTSRQVATAINQKQRLLYGADKIQEALEIAEHVLELAPEETAYHFNASLIYKKLGLLNKAKERIDKVLTDPDPEADHLMQAVDVYMQVGDKQKAAEAFAKLRQLHPEQAALFALHTDTRGLI